MSFDLSYIEYMVPVAWLALLITITVLAFRRKWQVAGATLLSGSLLLGMLVVTPPGHRGVIYSWTGGISQVERPQGVTVMLPLFMSANMVNVRVQKYENLEVYAQTKDLLEVTVQVGVNYRIEANRSAEVFEDIGKHYERDIIEPAVLTITKRQVGLVEAVDFPARRLAIADAITDDLTVRLERRGIEVTYVAIQDNIFDPDFVKAVLDKEVADEKAATALRQVEIARNEAESVRVRASGDADAIAFRGDGERAAIEAVVAALDFSPEEYLDWLQLNRWDGRLPSTLVGEAGDLALLLGVE